MIIDIMIEHDSLPDAVRFKEVKIGQHFLTMVGKIPCLKITEDSAVIVGDSSMVSIQTFMRNTSVRPLTINFKVV